MAVLQNDLSTGREDVVESFAEIAFAVVGGDDAANERGYHG